MKVRILESQVVIFAFQIGTEFIGVSHIPFYFMNRPGMHLSYLINNISRV